MSCEEYQELLITDLCGEIAPEEAVRLQSHVDQCGECKHTSVEFRAIKGLVKQLPEREWDEKLRISQLLRQNQRWRTIIFSKAALYLITLTALITVISSLPIHWELSSNQFAVSWGNPTGAEDDLSRELKNLQVQLTSMQRQNQTYYQVSEKRIKELVEQNNIEQQKRYWQTLQMFANYVQMEHKADMQKIQHDIATTYDRTGQEVERTNELLEYVLRTSASEVPEYVRPQ